MTAHRIGSGRPLPEQRITPPEPEGCQHCRGKGCPGCVEGWEAPKRLCLECDGSGYALEEDTSSSTVEDCHTCNGDGWTYAPWEVET
jgi:DnaJ-class molecular chaperone